jgi:uncharacterized membrane protein
LKSYFPLIIGGLLPAVFWGITAVFQKLSAAASLGPGRYLMLFGAIIAASGALYAYISNEAALNSKGAMYAVAAGLAFSLGTGLLSFALWRFDLPISRVSPILSANVLIPVAVGVVLLGEGSAMNPWLLLLGTALIVAGVILVTRS